MHLLYAECRQFIQVEFVHQLVPNGPQPMPSPIDRAAVVVLYRPPGAG